jgi:hypothetical protein
MRYKPTVLSIWQSLRVSACLCKYVFTAAGSLCRVLTDQSSVGANFRKIRSTIAFVYSPLLPLPLRQLQMLIGSTEGMNYPFAGDRHPLLLASISSRAIVLSAL